MIDVNYWAVLVGGVVAMIVGGLWYGPLFGKAWMRGMGWDPNNAELMEKMKKKAGPAYLQMFILALVQAYVLAHGIWAFGIAMPDVTGVSAGLQSGFWIWLGFVLPIKYGDKLWGGKQFKYVAVDLAYYLVILLITGVIISVWG